MFRIISHQRHVSLIYSILHLTTPSFLTAYNFTVSRMMAAAIKLPFPQRSTDVIICWSSTTHDCPIWQTYFHKRSKVLYLWSDRVPTLSCHAWQKWNWNNGEMILTEEHRSAHRRTYPSATLSPVSLTSIPVLVNYILLVLLLLFSMILPSTDFSGITVFSLMTVCVVAVLLEGIRQSSKSRLEFRNFPSLTTSSFKTAYSPSQLENYTLSAVRD
jgi:hypothetical protein